MNKSAKTLLMAGVAGLAALCLPAMAQETTETRPMSFFVTSAGLGDGANLGGLEGADAHCQQLAEAAGAGELTWAAYLSTQGEGAVNARDRIGSGPWFNANGQLIAASVDELHTEGVNINPETAIDERGASVPFIPEEPVENGPPIEHDMLTGSQADGTAFAAGHDMTCGNWTSNAEGAAMLGHHDRRGRQAGINSWNAAHPSRGCSQDNLVATGGSGRFFCFATNLDLAAAKE